MQLEIRPYVAGDEHAIFELFEIVFGRKISPSFWRWRHLNNPFGGPWIQLAWSAGKLVANYAASSAALSVDGVRHRVGLSMTTMTHPEFRGHSLFARTGRQLYDRMVAGGYVGTFGFPNSNVHTARTAHLGWKDIQEIPTLSLHMDDAPTGDCPRVKELIAFGSDFDQLWARIAATRTVCFTRDRAALDWRFSKNPVNDYRIGALFDGEALRGYVVVKEFCTGLDIVDFIAEELGAAQELICWALQFARRAHALTISTWSPTNSLERLALERSGFVHGAPVTYFGGRLFENVDADVFDNRAWFYSQADSDLY